jgi:hypothetical protein|uniref:Uncharacterized protein n=1 Tax=Ackermannviridae sp. TaxID=2831612 RepID=A0A8S5VMQ5_9CAUD|nr:MAG TPA: hypothetical protein [Ackermannviridae sp.]
MTQIERMPRPTGVTILAQQMNKAKSKKLRKTRKEKLISHIVNIYTMSGFRLNDRTLSIPQLAHLLNTKVETIQSCMLGTSHTLEAFKDPQRLQDTAAALANMSTLWAIQDRGTIQHQLEILLKSQGDKYAPFISGEISRTLSTLLQSNKQVAEIFRTFYASGSTININNNLTQNNQSQSLTVEEAYKIVQTSQPKEIQTDNIKQAKILDQPQLKLLEEKEHISLDILHKYDHIDNSVSKARSEKRMQQIEDVDWIEDTIPELQKQLQETEDKTLRQRIQDKILTLQKAEERKSKGIKDQVEDWEEEDIDQDTDEDLIPDSLQKEKPTKNKEIHQSTSTLSKSNSKESNSIGMDLGLGNGIPYLDGVPVSDNDYTEAVSDIQGSVEDLLATNQGSRMESGPQFLGMGKGSLRPNDSKGQDSHDGLKDLDPKPQTALNPNPVSGNKGPISLSPKKKRKYQYGDTIQPLKAKDKKAQRHLKSLARRQVDVIEDDSLPNRE